MHEPRAAIEARFTEVFEAQYAAVLAYARRRSRLEADAQESAAETFMVAWRRFDELRDERVMLPWLYAVARRVIANRRRGEARRNRLLDRLAAFLPRAAPAPSVNEVDLDPVLWALARLSEGDQELLRLIAWEGLSNGEAALVLRCSPANVSVRLHRARNRLGRELDRFPVQSSATSGHLENGKHLSGPVEEKEP